MNTARAVPEVGTSNTWVFQLSPKSADGRPVTHGFRRREFVPGPRRPITLGGEVETSGPVTGDTSALTCGTSDEASAQSISLAAVLSVKPNDNLDLALTLDFVGGHLQPHAVDGPLSYAGPTSVTFGPEGEVVGLELDSFTDYFTLTRAQR